MGTLGKHRHFRFMSLPGWTGLCLCLGLLCLSLSMPARAGESIHVRLDEIGLEYSSEHSEPPSACACHSYAHGPFSCPCQDGLDLEHWCQCASHPEQCHCAAGHSGQYDRFCCPCNPCPCCAALAQLQTDVSGMQATLKAIDARLATPAPPKAAAGRQYDYKKFGSRLIRMYYYTDIRQLMYQLRPVKDPDSEITFQDNSVQELDGTTLAEVRTAEEGLRIQLEKVTQARNAAIARDRELNETFKRLYVAQARQKTAVANEKKLSSSTTATPEQRQQAAIARTEADNEVSAIESELHPTDTDATTPFAKLSEAQAELDKQQSALDAQRVALEVLHSKEVESFGSRRDNAPLLFALGSEDALNPLERVSIFGLPDSHQLIIRGELADVEVVAMDIKQELDEPSPQSTLAIWNLELNTSASRKGDDQVNWAMDQIQLEFRDTREQIDIVNTVLRDCIADVISKDVKVSNLDTMNYSLNRFLVYDDSVLKSIGLSEAILTSCLQYRETINSAGAGSYSLTADWTEKSKSAASEGSAGTAKSSCRNRLPAELEELYMLDGSDPSETSQPAQVLSSSTEKASDISSLRRNSGLWRNYIYSAHIMPDPAKSTTLSEELVVLSLMRDDLREKVLDNFETSVCTKLGWQCLDKEGQNYFCFDRLRRLLNCDNGPDHREAGSNVANQRIITDALTRDALEKYFPRFVDNMSNLVNEVPALQAEKDEYNDNKPFTKLTPEQKFSLLQRRFRSGSRIDMRKLVETCGPDYYKVANFFNAMFWIKSETSLSYSELFMKARLQRENDIWFYDESEINAEEAKANAYLKAFSKAMQDELDEYFVDPMLSRLRSNLSAKGLGVGVIQRDSILASNRLVARIDPRTSAEFTIGTTANPVEDALQLSRLLGIVEPLQGAGLNTLEKTQQAAAGLGGLPQQSDPAEIYGFSSGNTFKVTPIHEPGGQSLRFRFDYRYGNRITDPDGSAGTYDPALPRFEYNSINTEVQLDSGEIRMVGSHETNAAFGKVEKKIGGIPFLKDDPIIGDLPLIGYFKRSGGKAALRQHHMVFAQATIYPTISEVLSLMTTPIPYDTYHLESYLAVAPVDNSAELEKANRKLKADNENYQKSLKLLQEQITTQSGLERRQALLVKWDSATLKGELVENGGTDSPVICSFELKMVEDAQLSEFVRLPSFDYRNFRKDDKTLDDAGRLKAWLAAAVCCTCQGDCKCQFTRLITDNPGSFPTQHREDINYMAILQELPGSAQAFAVGK